MHSEARPTVSWEGETPPCIPHTLQYQRACWNGRFKKGTLKTEVKQQCCWEKYSVRLWHGRTEELRAGQTCAGFAFSAWPFHSGQGGTLQGGPAALGFSGPHHSIHLPKGSGPDVSTGMMAQQSLTLNLELRH